ncbi:MAG: cohesin domain-containing protein, partial [Phycisphaerae bacterium]
MRRGRRTQIIRINTWLWVFSSAMPASLASGGDSSSTASTQSVLSDTRVFHRVVKMAGGLSECETDLDCDDGNACTRDVCSGDVCSNPPIPGCVPCVIEYTCPPLDVVFIMDTSGSMKDEAAALCSGIEQMLTELAVLDVVPNITLLGITETPDSDFPCLTNDVVTLLGGTVPGDPTSCEFPNTLSAFESWGPATAIVAERFGWIPDPDAIHLIIPIADEGSCNGSLPDGCNDPGDDRDSIENAIAVATAPGNDVIVSPITGTGSDACVTGLAGDLAAGTGGSTFQTQDPGTDLVDAIAALMLEHCEMDDSCDDGEFCTVDDTCVDGVCIGAPRDCSFLDDQCNVGVCNEDLDTCERQPTNEGEPCDDQDACNVGETCQNGTCSGGSAVTCPDNEDPCTDLACDPDGPEGNCDGIVAVNEDGPCDDGDVCTTGDTCQDGECVGGPPLDCNDDDVCTDDLCDPESGCFYAYNTDPCDDGDLCTIHDACDGAGNCVGIPMPTDLECETDEDCFGAVCNPLTGYCVCNEEPELCLEAAPGSLPTGECYGLGKEFAVNVVLYPSIALVAGGQFFTRYDPTALEVIDVAPGGTVDPSSPFVEEVFKEIDESEGTIFYAVRIALGGTGTHGPVVMATIRFRAIASCATVEPLCPLNENPQTTRLVDIHGNEVPYIPCCTDELL